MNNIYLLPNYAQQLCLTGKPLGKPHCRLRYTTI